MEPLKLYRKRLIPAECILLKDDAIIKQTEDIIVTKWITLNPKISFQHGCSCYFLKEGFKISKFYRSDNTLLYWYCDIVDFEHRDGDNSLVVTDLLVDVVFTPEGCLKVLDLDELADALEKKIINEKQLSMALRRLNNLLTLIHKDKFDYLQAELDNLGL